MSRHIVNNFELLQALGKMNSRQRVEFLKHSDISLILAICECALNVLKGNVELRDNQKRRLARFKKFIRMLAQKKVPWKRKKKHLIQKGGAVWIPLLINAAISALLSQLG